jgi:LPXTG-site transpeptidase (sortase) family protein
MMGFFVEPRAYRVSRWDFFGMGSRSLTLERALWCAGALLLAWCGWTLAQARAYQGYESWSLDRLRDGQSVSMASYIASRIGIGKSEVHSAPRPGEETEAVPARGDLVGRLDIPRLGLSAMVLEGVDGQTLKLGVGHVPGTALPGRRGNVALAAHRDTFFRSLHGIRASDAIELTTLRRTYRYTVDFVRIVDPDDAAVLRDTPRPSLTLVTCYPFHWVGNAPKRFVVQATRVESN